jgi:hypothetical protein
MTPPPSPRSDRPTVRAERKIEQAQFIYRRAEVTAEHMVKSDEMTLCTRNRDVR